MAAHTRCLGTTAEDDEVMRALAARSAGLADAYARWLPVAGAAILERLLSALAREGIGLPHVEAVEGGRVTCTFGPQGRLRAEFTTATATGRLVLAGLVVFDCGGGPETVEHPVQALDALARGGALDGYPAQAIDVVRRELADSVRNYALAMVGAQARRGELAPRAAAAGIRTALEWARAQQATDPAFSALAFFEQWVIDGHPLHPGAKIKLGLTPEEVMAYSPEWGARLTLSVAAVHRDHVGGAGGDVSLTELLRAEHRGLGEAADRAVRAAGGRAADYELVPVHPWQAARVLPHRYGRHLAAGTVVMVAGAGIPATPLMNLRTFAPAPTGTARCPSHLKTAIDVRLTGAVRGVSPQVAENGPRVSRLLADVVRRERGFAGRLVVLAERAGTHFVPGEGDDPALSRSLGAVARTSPEEGLAAGEMALPVAALYGRSPLTAGPIVAEALDELTAAETLAGRAAAAQRFAAVYAEVTVEPLLTLLTRYGIALEAHPQNAVVIIRGGLPVRLAIRDLGAVRISAGRLARAGLRVRLLAGSAIAARSDDEMRGKLFFSFFGNHLGELLACLAGLSSCPEAALWAPFAAEARRAFALLRQDVGDAARADERALFDRPLPLKTMLAMRFTGAVHEESFVDAPNPLCGGGPAR